MSAPAATELRARAREAAASARAEQEERQQRERDEARAALRSAAVRSFSERLGVAIEEAAVSIDDEDAYQAEVAIDGLVIRVQRDYEYDYPPTILNLEQPCPRCFKATWTPFHDLAQLGVILDESEQHDVCPTDEQHEPAPEEKPKTVTYAADGPEVRLVSAVLDLVDEAPF